MLAYITASDRGEGDRLLARVARCLQGEGIALAGVVQENTETAPDRPCIMDLRLLTDGRLIRISQSLGPLASGCRLDAAGLEEAAGLVSSALSNLRPGLLIVNKFGKQEVEGRGFRPVIVEALDLGVPVLTCVSHKNRDGFDRFVAGAAQVLPLDEAAVLDWCRLMSRSGTTV